MTGVPGGGIAFVAGSAHPELAAAVAAALGVAPWPATVGRFPDGEVQVELREPVRGRDVFLLQPTSPPVDDNLVELLLLADACRRAGAARLTAVVPYFGYARQDRRTRGLEPIAARVVADLLRTAGLDRLVAVDLHSPTVEGFLSFPLEHLTAVPLLAEAVRRDVPADCVVVAPDLGAVKLAERYAALLGAPLAIVAKTRLGPSQVKAEDVIGDVAGRTPLIVDDMISTGGTVEAAVKAAVRAGSHADFVVAATHGVFSGACAATLAALPLRRLVVTDSVPARAGAPEADRVSVAPLLAEAILRLHRDAAGER